MFIQKVKTFSNVFPSRITIFYKGRSKGQISPFWPLKEFLQMNDQNGVLEEEKKVHYLSRTS